MRTATEYINEPRHWCPLSEKYTGVDSLLSALLDGWEINRRVLRHETRISSYRSINIYYFELQRKSQIVTMAVVHNPHIVKVIQQYRLQVITHTFFERVEVATVEAKAIKTETETMEAETVKQHRGGRAFNERRIS